MTDQPAVISVRGHAGRMVTPDLAVVALRAWAVRADRTAALAALAELQDQLTARLAALGGAPFAAETDREPLTWLVRPPETYAQRHRGRPPGRGRLTGQVVAHAFSTVRVRDLPLLEGIESIVADTATARRQSIRWHVDSDNSAWQQVREDAIRQAVEQARHYAAALGGAITAVEHVADLGLLGSGRRGGWPDALAFDGYSGRQRASVQPQPIEVHAGVEARFTARVAPV